MAYVRKKNRVLSVTDNAVASYLAEGYDEIDKTGKVIKEATGGKKVTVEILNKVKAETEKLKKENEALEKESEALKKEIEALKAATKPGEEKPADKKTAEKPKK